jgi:cytidyltransferase-like protein
MSQEAEQRRVFVSGCYDILHAGHVQFFREARALGSHLTVSFAGEAVLFSHKQKRSSLPDEHKAGLIGALECVDEVVVGDSLDVLGLDFITHFRRIQPHYLAVTEDDKYEQVSTTLPLSPPS